MRIEQQAKASNEAEKNEKRAFKFTCWETTINCIMEVDERRVEGKKINFTTLNLNWIINQKLMQ
jgi:hypothetical protein